MVMTIDTLLGWQEPTLLFSRPKYEKNYGWDSRWYPRLLEAVAEVSLLATGIAHAAYPCTFSLYSLCKTLALDRHSVICSKRKNRLDQLYYTEDRRGARRIWTPTTRVGRTDNQVKRCITGRNFLTMETFMGSTKVNSNMACWIKKWLFKGNYSIEAR